MKNITRKRLVRLVVISFVTFFLIVLAAVALLYFQQQRLVRLAVKELNKQLPGELVVEGSDISPFQNFPYVSIALKNGRLDLDQEGDGQLNIVEASQISRWCILTLPKQKSDSSMTQELILKNIAKHISLDKEEVVYFVALLRQKEVSRKEYILKEGQLCKDISFVHSGILRAFYRDRSGRESTIMFAMEDWWLTDMYCFINQQPAMLNIEALEDSCIFQLQKSDLDDLYVNIPKFERFFRIIMQNAYIREQLRVIQNLSLSAEERYHHFLAKYPHVAKQVTQKQIASYLGITPEFLSMIRANRNKKDIS